MKRASRLFIGMTAALLLGVAAKPSTAAPIISVGPYVVGPTFTVPIQISGVSDLVTWQFDLAFIPTDFQATAVSEGPFTSNSGFALTLFIPGVIDNVSGLVSLVAGAYLDLPPGPSGSGVLALVDFTTIGQGNSSIRIQDPLVLEGSSVPAVVPEPTTLTLLASGLLLHVRVLAKRKSRLSPAYLE
jgi:hypothetical protein